MIPTYNEAAVIESSVTHALAQTCHPDVLVVDDNSPDATASIVTALAARSGGRAQLLSRPGKAGLGRAYSAGFMSALAQRRYDVVVQMDADGSHSADDLDRLVDALADADLAIGSRYVPGGSCAGLTRGRQWLSRLGNMYARLMLRVPVKDLTGGFKAWRTDLLLVVDPSKTTSEGYAFQVEMTLRAARSGARIKELPITFHERQAGSSKMSWQISLEALIKIPQMTRQTVPCASGHRDRHLGVATAVRRRGGHPRDGSGA